jgi:hypothetical protein
VTGVRAAVVLAVAMASLPARADVEYRGPIALDARAWFAPPAEPAQDGGLGVSFMAEPELSVAGARITAVVRPFARVDSQDPARTHYDLRRGEIVWARGGLELGAGAGLFHWGVMDGARLADVVNQLDLVEDADMDQKLGQPYAGGTWSGESFSLQLLGLPYHRARTFPGLAGRLRPSTGIDASDPSYETELGAWTPGAAARAAYTGEPLELGLSGMTGIGREPRLVAQLTDERLGVAYDRLDQAAVDASITVDGLVLKLEGASRWHTGERLWSYAVAGGAEYTRLGLFGDVDVTLLAEYVHDRRPPGAPATLHQDDVFAGLRVALNDAGGTELVAGGFIDALSGFTAARAVASRRLDDHFKLYAEARLFTGPADAVEWWLLGDSYAQLRLAYFL